MVTAAAAAAAATATATPATDRAFSRMERRGATRRRACAPPDAPIRPPVRPSVVPPPFAPFHNTYGGPAAAGSPRRRTPPFTCRRDAPAGRSASPTGVTARPVAATIVILVILHVCVIAFDSALPSACETDGKREREGEGDRKIGCAARRFVAHIASLSLSNAGPACIRSRSADVTR